MATFRNPVHGRPFADPMVLKFNGPYYAYGTPNSGGLPVLRSSDLAHWEESGEILAPRPAGTTTPAAAAAQLALIAAAPPSARRRRGRRPTSHRLPPWAAAQAEDGR